MTVASGAPPQDPILGLENQFQRVPIVAPVYGVEPDGWTLERDPPFTRGSC